MCLPELVVYLAEEVTRLRTENTRTTEECARLAAENTRLVEDHARLRDQSTKITEELKTRNQDITSK
jgi:phenylpyruvate tautomerase PptA (4-oxalocrotonate tautomerase family)